MIYNYKISLKSFNYLVISLLFVFVKPIFPFEKGFNKWGENSYITSQKEAKDFKLSESGKSTPLFISSKDYPGVIRALKDLQSDIKKVTNAEPAISFDNLPKENELVIVGTLGKNEIIDQLVSDKKLDVKNIAGKWESYLIKVVENPIPGIEKALVITGSDKRFFNSRKRIFNYLY